MTPQILNTQDRKALWFTLAPIAITLLLLAAVAFKQQMFTASDRLFAFAESGVGITNGMPVKLQGFVIGSVREIVLVAPEDGALPKVRLTLEVTRDAMRYIGRDSRVRFVQEGLIGQAILEIAHGTDRVRRAANGDVLAFERDKNLSEIASDISTKAQPVLANVQAFTQQLSDPQGDFALTLRSARQAMGRADDTLAKVGASATNTLNRSTELMQKVEKTVPKVDKLLDSSDALLQQVQKTLPKVDGVLDEALEVSQSAKLAVGRTQGLIDSGGLMVEDAGRVTKSAMRSWPFSAWAPKAAEPVVPIDSQDNSSNFITPQPTKVAP